MNTLSSTHLNDDQFMECALSTPSVENAAHLAQCEQCRAELATFHDSVGDFGRASSGWSEAMPKVSLRPLAKARRQRAIVVQTAWALAAVVLLVVGLPMVRHHYAAVPAGSSVATAAPVDSPAQIAQDNQLMQSVYIALAPNDPSPFQEYHVSDTMSPRVKAGRESRVQ